MIKYKGYKIEKKNRVMRMADNSFEPANYEVWKVTGPNKFQKYFTTQKDAKAFIKSYTDTTANAGVISHILNPYNYK